jgi:GTPase SAR1 family protein
MTENKNILTIFSKFLNQKYKKKDFDNQEELLKLPIKAFKFLTDGDVQIITELFKFEKIQDFARIKKKNLIKSLVEFQHKKGLGSKKDLESKLKKEYDKFLSENPEINKKFLKALTITSILFLEEENIARTDTKAQKIICVGLDNAGKTAILSRLGEKMHIDELAHLEPTKGIKRKLIKTPNLDLFIWDFGGQANYRTKYLENPEKYFLGLDLLMYVIDVQDPERFEESFEYFEEIIDIMISLEENPYILIFIHKYDPDLKDEPEILLHIEYVKDRITEIFEKKDLRFEQDIYTTSIYSLVSNEPEFSKFIKDTMRKNLSLTDPTLRKVDGLGRTLEEVMNAVIRLSESLSKQLNDIDSRLRAIESGAFHIAQSGVPIEIEPEEKGIRGGDAVRSQVLNELKDIFAKKKRMDR